MTGGGLRWLLWKDLRLELRSKESLLAGLALVALFFLVDLFAVVDLAGAAALATVVLWGPLVFATTAAMGRAWSAEHDQRTLDLVRAAPVPLAWAGISRTLVNALVAGLLLAATLAGAIWVFGLSVPPRLVLLLALAALGLAIVATLAGAVTAQARARELLLPLLVIPAMAPLVQAGVEGTLLALSSDAALETHLLLVAGYDLVAAGAAWLLWPHVLEADA
jgi:heme exporter protein B